VGKERRELRQPQGGERKAMKEKEEKEREVEEEGGEGR